MVFHVHVPDSSGTCSWSRPEPQALPAVLVTLRSAGPAGSALYSNQEVHGGSGRCLDVRSLGTFSSETRDGAGEGEAALCRRAARGGEAGPRGEAGPQGEAEEASLSPAELAPSPSWILKGRSLGLAVAAVCSGTCHTPVLREAERRPSWVWALSGVAATLRLSFV